MEEAKNKAVSHLHEELKKVREGLYGFQRSTNVYESKVYQDKKRTVQEALDKLESIQNNSTQSEGPS